MKKSIIVEQRVLFYVKEPWPELTTVSSRFCYGDNIKMEDNKWLTIKMENGSAKYEIVATDQYGYICKLHEHTYEPA